MPMREEVGLRSILQTGFNRKPSLVAQGYEHQIVSQALETPVLQAEEGQISLDNRSRMAGMFGQGIFEQDKPFAFSDGVAYIPIYGTLLNRLNFCGWGVTGYDFIRSQFDLAMDDSDVRGIVFDVNSYGGMVYGNFELSDYIASRNQEKPNIGMVNAMMFSGAMSLGSAFGRLVATPSADVGSIGVVMMHVDLSKALEQMGVAVSLIHAGDHKVDGNPYEPLSPDVKAAFQKRIDQSYDQFVALVARNRKMDESAVRATQADIFPADEAKALGLIDEVGTPNDVLSAFTSELSGSRITTSQRSITMSDSTKNDAGKNVDAPDHAAAVKADRERTKAITTSPEAKGREELASHLAYETNMSVEEATKTLSLSPKPAAASKTDNDEGDAPLKGKNSKKTPFEQAMSKGNPNIGEEGGDDEEEEQDEDTKKQARVNKRVAEMANAAGLKQKA